VAVLADDEMIVDRDFERLSDRDNLVGQLDVVTRRLRIGGGVIMHQNIPYIPWRSGNVQSFVSNHNDSMHCDSI
jgi:hypothetical protein